MAEPQTRRYLTFRSQAQCYALPAEEVVEIITVPPVARLPHSPPALLGMANLRGAAIPIASLGALLGGEAAPSARAILLGGAAPVALCIDHVDALVTLDEARIETAPAALAAAPGEKLRGAFEAPSGGAVAKILDIQPLLAAAFTPAANAKAQRGRATGRHAIAAPEAEAEMLLGFTLADQKFALPLREVREIITLPPAIAQMPRSEALLLGVTSQRGTLLPLLSLRGLLGLPLPASHGADSRVIVTRIGSTLAGLVVDAARAIIRAAPGSIQAAPSLLAARMGGEARVHSIHRDAASGHVTAILATATLFGDEVMSRLSQAAQHAAPAPAAPAASLATSRYLVFSLGAEEYALPIAAVDEVAAAPEKLTRLPKTPPFLEGVVNLRGDVLPVINQRRRFELPDHAGPPQRQRLVVARSQRHRAGLLVDAVAGVLAAAEAQIEPAPGLSGETTNLVAGLLNLPESGRMILLLNPDELLSRAERALLDKFAPLRKTED